LEALGPPELDDLVFEYVERFVICLIYIIFQLKNMMLAMTENDKSKYPLIEKGGKV
jgi:hypothetical protein